MYWKQQKGYGRAEALLEQKWPDKYNCVGHLHWSGRLYGRGLVQILGWPSERIYHGTWGSALFQSLYQPASGLWSALPTMPEWYLVILTLAGLSVLGAFWQSMLFAIPLLLATVAIPVVQAILSASKASFTTPAQSRLTRLKLYGLTSLLYLLQPLARLWGRLSNGLTPWRRRGVAAFVFPRPLNWTIWSEYWQPLEQSLTILEDGLRKQGAVVWHGSDFDTWDLELRGGFFGFVRILTVIEEHGSGKQLIRFRCWPRVAFRTLVMTLLLANFALIGAFDRAGIAAAILALAALLVLLIAFLDCAAATACCLTALKLVELQAGGKITH
jgi:hypothetical protein